MGSTTSRLISKSSLKNSGTSSLVYNNKETKQYAVLPVTSVPIDDEIERPYRSLNKVPSVKE